MTVGQKQKQEKLFEVEISGSEWDRWCSQFGKLEPYSALNGKLKSKH